MKSLISEMSWQELVDRSGGGGGDESGQGVGEKESGGSKGRGRE